MTKLRFIIPFKIRLENSDGENILQEWRRMPEDEAMKFKNTAFFFGPLLLAADKKYSPFQDTITLTSIRDVTLIYQPDPTYASSNYYMPLVCFTISNAYEKGSLTLTALSEQTDIFHIMISGRIFSAHG